jgi:hypothetical protein
MDVRIARPVNWPDEGTAAVGRWIVDDPGRLARWRLEVAKWRAATFDGLMPEESVRVTLAARLESESGSATAGVDWFAIADRIILLAA